MDVEKKIEIIQNEFDENKNSHIFLIETDNITNATNEVKRIISYALKADKLVEEQIKSENYIELTIIRSNGNTIIKDDILRLQEQIKTKPILSSKKFYIIIEAELLNESASNKLLKTIEEPQDDVYGFLITENISALLPTIKSRCQIEQLFYNEKSYQQDYMQEEIEIADNLIKIIETGKFKDYVIYKNNMAANELIKTKGKSVANIIKDYYNISCNLKKGNLSTETINIIKKNNPFKELIYKAKYMNNLLNKNTLNMNIELLIDKIIIELREVKENASSRN